MRKLAYCLALAMAVVATTPALATFSDQNAVYDSGNQVIKNTFGNCVRTQWKEGSDPCAPPKPKAEPKKPEPQPAPAPAKPPEPKISRSARTVYFDFDEAELTPQAIAKLNALIKKIKRSDRIKGAGIAAFADRMGGDEYNLELSRERAKSVYDYLSEHVDIDTRILDMRAYGEKQPKSNCAEKLERSKKIDCLKEDRRVEVLFIYEE